LVCGGGGGFVCCVFFLSGYSHLFVTHPVCLALSLSTSLAIVFPPPPPARVFSTCSEPSLRGLSTNGARPRTVRQLTASCSSLTPLPRLVFLSPTLDFLGFTPFSARKLLRSKIRFLRRFSLLSLHACLRSSLFTPTPAVLLIGYSQLNCLRTRLLMTPPRSPYLGVIPLPDNTDSRGACAVVLCLPMPAALYLITLPRC